MLPCLVLGGGLGSRLGSVTEQLPKPLVAVAGVPFAVRQLRWLASEGVDEVVYSIGYLGHLIREELGDRREPPGTVRFVDEGPQRLGTAGAIRLAIDQGALPEVFLVLYGDSYLDVPIGDVVEAFDRAGLEALMTVYPNDGQRYPSNARLEAGRVTRYDKADPIDADRHHIDYGLSILRASTVRRMVPPGEPADLTDVFGPLSAAGQLAGFEATNRFYEIGSAEGLAELRSHLEGQS